MGQKCWEIFLQSMCKYGLIISAISENRWQKIKKQMRKFMGGNIMCEKLIKYLCAKKNYESPNRNSLNFVRDRSLLLSINDQIGSC